jgi:hypothetical protein
MIRFEYDENTAGVRVSFVMKDEEASVELPDNKYLKEIGEWWGGAWNIPQTADNLKMVERMATAAVWAARAEESQRAREEK